MVVVLEKQQTKRKTLLDVCEFIVDSEHKTAPIQDEGIPYIRTPNLGKGRFIFDKMRYVSEETYQIWTKRAVPQKNDLILGREAPVGNIAIVENQKVCLGQRTVLIRPNPEEVLPEYLLFLLLGDEIQGKFQSLSNGSTVHHLNMSDIRGLSLPILPPKATQQKIAAILSAYDDLIENNTRRIAILEAMAQALYREWFVHFRYPGHGEVSLVDSPLGPIPQGWEIGSLESLMCIKSGFAFKSQAFTSDGKFKIITIKNVQDGLFKEDCDNKTDIIPPNLPSHCRLLEGDILLSLTGNVGRVCLVYGTNYLLNQRVAKLCPIHKADSAFSYLLFREPGHRVLLEKLATGVAQQNLSPILAGKMQIVLPPVNIRMSFSEIASPHFSQIIYLLRVNKNLRQTRDLLLPRLISGQVDVSELEVG